MPRATASKSIKLLDRVGVATQPMCRDGAVSAGVASQCPGGSSLSDHSPCHPPPIPRGAHLSKRPSTQQRGTGAKDPRTSGASLFPSGTTRRDSGVCLCRTRLNADWDGPLLGPSGGSASWRKGSRAVAGPMAPRRSFSPGRKNRRQSPHPLRSARYLSAEVPCTDLNWREK